jgi:hypothetical protein
VSRARIHNRGARLEEDLIRRRGHYDIMRCESGGNVLNI